MRVKVRGIYEILCVENGRIYVGSSVDVSGRVNSHVSALDAKRHRNPHLQSAWNKYGRSAFRFSIVEVVDDHESLLQKEQTRIDATDRRRLFNVCMRAGSPAAKGRIRSAEHVENLKRSLRSSVAMKRYLASRVARENLAAAARRTHIVRRAYRDAVVIPAALAEIRNIASARSPVRVSDVTRVRGYWALIKSGLTHSEVVRLAIFEKV